MELILTSIIAFATTNIDDIFILTLFFADNKYKPNEIYLGQYLGIVLLIAISILGSLLGLIIQPAYIGLLGFIPIYLGIRKLFSFKATEPKINKGASNILSVASVTFANGADNIGVYAPLFATLSIMEKSTMVVVFLIMTAAWCVAAKFLIKYPFLKKVIDKYGHIIAPLVLILLGLYIMYESGTIKLLI